VVPGFIRETRRIEQVMGFCSPEKYRQFMRQAFRFESMLVDYAGRDAVS
jgi:polyphosphate kinase 2 (PPK2 family)